MLSMISTTKVKVKKKSFKVKKKSYNKTVIDFKIDRHEDLSSLKSDIYLCLAASENITFSGR